jgi:hypothetical protein
MLNKECLFGLLVDSMGKIYFPITNAFLEDTGDTFDFNTWISGHGAPYKPVLEKSALVTPYIRNQNLVCTLPDGSTISNLNTSIILPKGTIITCTNPGEGYTQLVPVKYITKWVELPEMTQGEGHKYPVVFFRSYQLNNMVCINRIKFKKRA